MQARIMNENQTESAVMPAVIQKRYGGASVLQMGQVAVPHPAAGQVRVRVEAAGINRGDWHMITGKPYLVRLLNGGLFRPKKKTPGQDFAGLVSAIGEGVSGLSVGDRVMGSADSGAWAEEVCLPAERVVSLPAEVSFEEAAALPVGVTTAIEALRAAKLDSSEQGERARRVLINGASGGVGLYAVQLFKKSGARISAVCSAGRAAAVLDAGADTIIDYNRPWPEEETEFDMIVELSARRPAAEMLKLLRAGGRFITTTTGQGNVIGPFKYMLQMALAAKKRKVSASMLMTEINADHLEHIKRLYLQGVVKPFTAERWPFEQAAQALEAATGGKSGRQVFVKSKASE